ncbi:MAG: hypothetical protein AAFY67_12050 [Cyanobacteria bacterium J06642_9]
MTWDFQRLRVASAGQFLISTALTVSLTAIATSVQAVTFVSNRDALNETNRVDWSSVGAIFNSFGPPEPAVFLPSTFGIDSDAGLGVQVFIPEDTTPGLTPPFVFQTTPAPGIETNFDNGDFILFTGFIPGPTPTTGNPGPITLTFDRPILGAGAQLATDDTSSFTGTLSAFDENDNLLGTFSTPGTSSLALDNTAQFFGVLDERPTISKLEFKALVLGQAIGINQLSIVTATTSVPEPSMGFALAFFAGLGLLGCQYQRENYHV